jgi:hypothetical protein
MEITDRPASRGRRRWRRRAFWLIGLTVAIGLGVEADQWWTRPRPTPPTAIFRGVTYTCIEANDPDCRGLVHLVKVDLAEPGIELYLTPLDPEAMKEGWQYRLDSAVSVLRRENLAVVVNATYFSSKSGILQWSGDLARSVQTIIADGEVSHINRPSYMLWFESDLTPHLESTIPPPIAVLRHARWGVGGFTIAFWKGQGRGEGAERHEMDRRTAVGIDSGRKLLWLAAFENASSVGVARTLAEQGAQDGFLLDGGHSTTMALGAEAAHVQTGELLHGARPVATFLGIRAETLK